MGDKVFMQGNKALAESAIRAGCKSFFGYPITPSSEIPEYFASQPPERGITFIQAETEVSAFNMVAGAAAASIRAMTATSGPGFSLGCEAMSFMAAGGIPGVVVYVQRAGPADGEITAAQGDYFQVTKGGGHGDYRTLVLAPYSVQESADMIQEAFALAEKYRNPVVILSDAMIAKMMETVELPGEKTPPADFPWAIKGARGRPHNVITTCALGAEQWELYNLRLQEKFNRIKANEERYETCRVDDAEIILVAYGGMSRSCLGAMEKARAKGIRVGLIRPISLWPFPVRAFEGLGDREFLVIELSAGQMVEDVMLTVPDKSKIKFFGRLGGMVITPNDIVAKIEELYGKR